MSCAARSTARIPARALPFLSPTVLLHLCASMSVSTHPPAGELGKELLGPPSQPPSVQQARAHDGCVAEALSLHCLLSLPGEGHSRGVVRALTRAYKRHQLAPGSLKALSCSAPCLGGHASASPHGHMHSHCTHRGPHRPLAGAPSNRGTQHAPTLPLHCTYSSGWNTFRSLAHTPARAPCADIRLKWAAPPAAAARAAAST